MLHELAAKSDVFVENFIPGKAKDLGFDYETLSKVNPRIMCVARTLCSRAVVRCRTLWTLFTRAVTTHTHPLTPIHTSCTSAPQFASDLGSPHQLRLDYGFRSRRAVRTAPWL